jgi:Mrp family chromosome partitioning ATPase
MFSQGQMIAISQSAEVKRILSTTETLLGGEGGATLSVTSAERSEGKSLTAMSIAVSYLSMYQTKKVLLVDLNWQDPTIHQTFGITLGDTVEGDNGKSFSELLLGTTIKGLDVLVPTAHVIRHSLSYENTFDFFESIIEEAQPDYDLIVIDTRSLYPTSREMRIDPIRVCARSDATLMVTLAAVTKRQEAKRALKSLQTAGVENIGLVLNQWRNPIH